MRPPLATSARRARAARGAALCTALAAVALAAAACSGTPTSTTSVRAAPSADSAACATALAAAPAAVAGLARTPLGVAGTLSWGEPAVVLRCGLPAATPTTDPCLGVNGLDWTVDVTGDPYVFVSYGRSPAVELRVPARYGNDTAVAAVTDVGPIAAALPPNGRACVGPTDTATPSGTSP